MFVNLKPTDCLKKLSAIGIFMVMAAGCQAPYYLQAANGHLRLLAQRQPLATAQQDERLTHSEKQAARLIPDILDFAEKQLHLKSSGQYQEYVYLERPNVVTNVFVAPALSLNAKKWCYPIAGCVSYRGYYNPEKAQKTAARYHADGFDVYVAGVSAYSTLGWFHDPVLSSFLKLPESDLVGLLFHELAHTKLYSKGNTVFNESFAKTVEQFGVELWLKKKRLEEKKLKQHMTNNRSSKASLDHQSKHQQFIAQALTTKEKLRTLYKSQLSNSEKLKSKHNIIEAFKQNHSRLWGDSNAYDSWMQGPLNNAQFATLGDYYDLVAPLRTILEKLNGDLEAFYRYCDHLITLDAGKIGPQLKMDALKPYLSP